MISSVVLAALTPHLYSVVLFPLLFQANSPTEGTDEPLPDSVSGANRLPSGQCLLLHVPPTKFPQVSRVLQLSWDQLLQVKAHGVQPDTAPVRRLPTAMWGFNVTLVSDWKKKLHSQPVSNSLCCKDITGIISRSSLRTYVYNLSVSDHVQKTYLEYNNRANFHEGALVPRKPLSDGCDGSALLSLSLN